MKFSRVLLIAFLCHTASAARAAEAEREPDHISEILSLKGDWDESAIEAEYQAVVTEKGPTLARNIAQERLCEAVMLGKKEAITFFARKTGKNREELLLTTTKMGLGVNCMLLCEERTDIDRMAADGSRALSWAAYHLDTDLARALIQAGAKVSIKGNQDHRRPGEKLESGEKIVPYNLAERRINVDPADYHDLLELLMPPVADDFLKRLRTHYERFKLDLRSGSLSTILSNELMEYAPPRRATIAIEAWATCSPAVAQAITKNAHMCSINNEQEIAFLKKVISELEPYVATKPAVASTVTFLNNQLEKALVEEFFALLATAVRANDTEKIKRISELFDSRPQTLTAEALLRWCHNFIWEPTWRETKQWLGEYILALLKEEETTLTRTKADKESTDRAATAATRPINYIIGQWSPRSNELYITLKSLFTRLENTAESQEPPIAEILGMMVMDDKTEAEKTAIKSAFWFFRHEMRHKLRRLAITNLAGIEAFIQDIEAESAEA